ncbi:PAS domain-containing protein [Deltaproteobacteria bacterium OttesenSCG-928-K17]|nr:PAS domain-containing protein [Deltaproteobacteria bacterium OttesenSCG-928-K17]
MKRRNKIHRPQWATVPPWTVVAAVLGAMVLAGVMFNRDYRREQGHLKEMFLQRGEILIHSLEMVGRVRFGEQWEADHLQAFWNNLEENDNVLFLALTDEAGQPLAVVGDMRPEPSVFKSPEFQALPDSPGPIAPLVRMEKVNGRWVYMVYRPFWPQARPRVIIKDGVIQHHSFKRGAPGASPSRGYEPAQPQGRGEGRGRGQNVWRPPVRYMWVGFDLTPFQQASHGRVRTAAVFIGLFCLSILAGVLALIWGHNSRLARRMYQDTNALAAELIGRLPTGVIIKDSNGRVSLVNQSTLTISGLKENDWIGQTPDALTFGRFPAEDALAGREMDINFKGGHKVRVALTSGPVISDDGHPLGQVVLMEDLGELGRLKAELGKKERLATLGGLAAGLAHEIRNPLGAIRGLTQHLLGKGPADSTDREALEVMLASVDRLNATITDFLDYSRPPEIRAERLDLAELIRNMATLAGHDARAQAVKINLDLPAEAVDIAGDEALLSQAFLNLYINAIESAGAREGGGGRLSVALEKEAGRAILVFHDNGEGFSPEQLAHPFVPYFTTKAEGTGLGLALVEKTIRAHEGADISLANSPAGGGLITISFDLLEGDNNESDDQSSNSDC